jgi:hypothetical protein
MTSYQIKGKATINEAFYTANNATDVPTYKQAGTAISLSPRTGPSLETANPTGYSVSGTDLGQTYCAKYVEYAGNVGTTPTPYTFPITAGKYSSIKIVMCGGGGGSGGGGGNGTTPLGRNKNGGDGGDAGDGGIYVSPAATPIPSTTTVISIQVGGAGQGGNDGPSQNQAGKGGGAGNYGNDGGVSIVYIGPTSGTAAATSNGGIGGQGGNGASANDGGNKGGSGDSGSPADTNTATYNNGLSVTGPSRTVQQTPSGSVYCQGGIFTSGSSVDGKPGYVRIYLYV